MEIKIKDGSVFIKDFCPRKLKKQITKALLDGAEVKSIDGKSELSNISFQSMENGNDVALIGMTEKIVINGEEKPVSIDFYDEMDEIEVQKVIREINKITNKQLPLD